MTDSVLQIWPYLLAAAVAGSLLGWLIGGGSSKRRLDKLGDGWQLKFDDATRQRDTSMAENATLRSSIEAQQAVVNRHELAAKKIFTELQSAREQTKSQSKQMFALGAERDEAKNQLASSGNTLAVARQRITDLEADFVKASAFYKGELEKSIDKRKSLEAKVNDAKLEHESLSNLLESARSEHASVNNMLASAKARLAHLDALEDKAIKLEAENAQFRHDAALTRQEIEGLQRDAAEIEELKVQNKELEDKAIKLETVSAKLRHDAALTRQEIEGLQRDVAELEELKVQNKELAHCLDSIEESRKQYESDAKRYRDQAKNSEKQSDTMRVRLDDVEKSFADIEKRRDKEVKNARKKATAEQSNGHAPLIQEVDDLTEIVGIGKAFQQILHSMGVVCFRQIAAFGAADVARVNMELKEHRGRMEQDDWIGQAKELLYKKYGSAETH